MIKVGDLVRPNVKGGMLSNHAGVIWRVVSVTNNVGLEITPVFALFGTNLLLANRQCTVHDVMPLDVVALGNEFAAFTQFIKSVVKQSSE